MKKLIFSLLAVTFLVSCSNDDNNDLSSDNKNNNPDVFNELVGSWLIQESKINGTAVDTDSFNCLKTSIAEFRTLEYTLNYRKKGSSICSITQEFSGTYRLNSDGSISLNSIDDNLSATLKDGELIITSKEGNSTQVDTFINEKDIINTATELPTEDETEPESNTNTEALKALITKLKGTWSIEKHEVNNNTLNISDCGKQNTISINEDGIITLIQNNTTYTKADLNKYGVGFSGPEGSIQDLQFEGSFGSGSSIDKIIIDSKANCKFIKESTRALSFVSTNIASLSSSANIKWVDQSTIELQYKNSQTQTTGVVTFKK